MLSSNCRRLIYMEHEIGIFIVPICRSACFRRFISDTPLTIRGSNMPVKKVYKDLKVKEMVEKENMMDPVDIHELARAHQGYARHIDRFNLDRVKRNMIKNYRGLTIVWICVFVVVGIYFYSCYALGRETFLEEIDEEVAIERGELELDEYGNSRPKNVL